MKTIVYLTGGLGDLYSFLAVWLELKVNLDIEERDVHYHFNNGVILNSHLYPQASKSYLKLLKNAGVNKFNLISKENGSCIGIQFPDGLRGKTHQNGPNFNSIKNDFLFFRNATLKAYMRRLCDGGQLIDAVLPERTYLWRDGEYTSLTFENSSNSLIRNPIPSYPSKKDIRIVNDICSKKHVLIHVRMKTDTGTIDDFNIAIDWCSNNGIVPILIGLRNIETGSRTTNNKSEMAISVTNETIDLMDNKISLDGCFYLIQKATHMITSSSGFGYHRLYCQNEHHKTLCLWPISYGHWDAYVYDSFIQNNNNEFYNLESSSCSQNIIQWLKHNFR